MSNFFDDVGRFHGKFNLPVSHETWRRTGTSKPGLISKRDFDFRVNFMHEEIRELIEGNAQGNLTQIADALVDLVYVALGTAHYFGLPFQALWDEVHRANMEKQPWKEGDPVKPRNASGLEVVKPEGWLPPDIEGVIRDFRDYHGMKNPEGGFTLEEGAFGGEPDEYTR